MKGWGAAPERLFCFQVTELMARITVEDCLSHERNRFALVRLASRRAKMLLSGQSPVTDTRGNKAIVSALREIADGKVEFRPRSEPPAAPEETIAAPVAAAAEPAVTEPATETATVEN